MSYDLVFWRQGGPLAARPEAIYGQLIEGERADGLLELNIESFLATILDRFPGAVRERNGNTELIVWSASERNASFQVEWSPQYVVVCCRGTTNEEMNRLIDIGIDHDCRLYDPQVGERFG